MSHFVLPAIIYTFNINQGKKEDTWIELDLPWDFLWNNIIFHVSLLSIQFNVNLNLITLLGQKLNLDITNGLPL